VIKVMQRLCVFSVLLCSLVHAEKIPQIDWRMLEQTKPWEATEQWEDLSTVRINTSGVPSDAIVLFEHGALDKWQRAQWPIPADLAQTAATAALMEPDYVGDAAAWDVSKNFFQVKAGTGAIASKQAFGNIQLHIEWMAPKRKGKQGQHYSNSGVFLMGLYEVQILNSFDNPTYSNGQAASIYKQRAPSVNASREPNEWQSYDIVFTAPTFHPSKELNTPAYLTVIHNGVLVHNHVELKGPTLYIGESEYVYHAPKLPLILQDHGDPVRFRNIWLREF